MSETQPHVKCLVLRRGKGLLFLTFQGNRLIEASAASGDAGIGTITIGKIKNIVENIKAAFVEYLPGELGFLPLDELPRTQGKRACQEQEIVVQIKKEAIKSKQPVLTTNLSISGKYAVVTSGRPGISYSGKLSDASKKKIKSFFSESIEIDNKSTGIIIRTGAGTLADYRPLSEEIASLQQKLSSVKGAAQSRTCYSVLYREQPDYLRSLRDFPEGMIEEVITDDLLLFTEIEAFCQENPSFCLPPVRLYNDPLYSLSKLYSVDTRLKEAQANKVWLKSGGYLIIEPTEALTVIDVNTGKFAEKKTTEETFYKMNLEAAEEIALQLRLRNLSGILIVDFINMRSEDNQRALLDAFKRHLMKDRIKTSIPQMTSLGLVEFTRKKTISPLAKQLEELMQE